jgi:ElaB/YqjD/DUF883 family membrane-anchored ribosome-binding protein
MTNNQIPVRQTNDGAAGESESPEEIRREIERTRSEMSETIDAIQGRLSPEVIKTQAKEAIREATVGKAEEIMNKVEYTAREKSSGLIETIKHNPVPAALAGIGIGWLLMSSRKDDHRDVSSKYQYAGQEAGWRGAYGERYPIGYGEYRDRGARGATAGMADQARHMADDMRHRTDEMADRAKYAADDMRHRAEDARHAAGEAVSRAGERAGEMVDQAREQVSNLGERAQYGAYRAKDMAYEHPMFTGAVAFGLGAVVGMILPETRKEHEWLGEARENLMEKAKDTASTAVQQARSQVVDKVAETVHQVTEDVKHQAQDSDQQRKAA